MAVRLTASVSGEEALQSESFTIYMGTTTLAAGSFGSDVLIGSKTVEVGFPAAAIAACAGCRIEAQFYVLDLAGQLASRTWRSEPISAANHAEYTLSGDFIRRPAYHLQIPVRIPGTTTHWASGTSPPAITGMRAPAGGRALQWTGRRTITAPSAMGLNSWRAASRTV